MNFSIEQQQDGRAALRADGELMDLLSPADAKRVLEAWALVKPYVDRRMADIAARLREIAAGMA